MKWIPVVFFLPFLLLVGALLLNRPPLLSPPGPLKRFMTYLATNVAETHPEHAFAELRPRHFPLDADKTRVALLDAMRSLGWEEILESQNEIQAVVATRFLAFRDDVVVKLAETADGTLRDAPCLGPFEGLCGVTDLCTRVLV